jgi:hypothetical protein
MMTAARGFLVAAAFVQLSFIISDSTGNLRASPPSSKDVDAKLADTVRALDANGNGKVDQSELTGFAKSQGLSSEEVLADFKELDVNNDGALDSSEIGPLFGMADTTDTTVSDASTDGASPSKTLAAGVESAPATQKTKLSSKDTASARPTSASQDKIPLDLDLVALERDAQTSAGGVIASRLAQRAQVLLARSEADEKKAQTFDAAVRTLRSNATNLAKMANQETRKAALEASDAVSHKSMAKLTQLQKDEQKSEEAADEHREQAKKAMERVRTAQASLRNS